MLAVVVAALKEAQANPLVQAALEAEEMPLITTPLVRLEPLTLEVVGVVVEKIQAADPVVLVAPVLSLSNTPSKTTPCLHLLVLGPHLLV